MRRKALSLGFGVKEECDKPIKTRAGKRFKIDLKN